MNFKNSVTPLGYGAATYARADEKAVTVLLRHGGAIYKIVADLDTKAVKNVGVLSLAEECVPLENGRVEKLGEMYYVDGI